MNGNALAGLRDYHMPGSLQWWPPAPGWWLLAIGLALAGAVLWLRRRRRTRGRLTTRLALRELARLRETWTRDGDDMAFLRQLATLLRRYALARWPVDDAAGLSGDAWRGYLAAKCATAPVSVQSALAGALGEALTDLAYRPVADIDPESLAAAAEELVRHGAVRESRP
jgi:LPXTG-motif cell wall-anchored protein